MSKLFASDLDGTLFNAFHSTDFIILHGLRKIIRRKDCFVIATGRNMRKAHIEYDFKDLKVYCIAMNGAMILDPDKQIIYEKGIPAQIIEELMNQFPDVNFEFIGRENVYVMTEKETAQLQTDRMNFMVRLIYRRFKKMSASEYIYQADRETVLQQDILKVNCTIRDPLIRKRFDRYLEENTTRIVNAPFEEGTYEITACGVNKGTAIRILAEQLGIRDEEIYVYGDGDNDVAMLKMFRHSYAPENACDNARKAAGEILGSNRNYSVIRHMLKQKTAG